MSLLHFYSGPCVALWTPGRGFLDQSAQEIQLGISEDSVEIKTVPYYENIYTDSRGGESGHRSDRIYLGCTAEIKLRLTKFQDDTVNQKAAPAPFVEQLLDGLSGGPTTSAVPGLLNRVGYFERDDEHMGTLKLDNTVAVDPAHNERVITFTNAVLKQGGKKNEGTRYMTIELLFEALINSDTERKLYEITNTVPSP